MIRVLLTFVFTFLSFNDICSASPTSLIVKFFKLKKNASGNGFTVKNPEQVGKKEGITLPLSYFDKYFKGGVNVNDVFKDEILKLCPNKDIKLYAVSGYFFKENKRKITANDCTSSGIITKEVRLDKPGIFDSLVNGTAIRGEPLCVLFYPHDKQREPIGSKKNNSNENGSGKKCCC